MNTSDGIMGYKTAVSNSCLSVSCVVVFVYMYVEYMGMYLCMFVFLLVLMFVDFVVLICTHVLRNKLAFLTSTKSKKYLTSLLTSSPFGMKPLPMIVRYTGDWTAKARSFN